MESKSDHIAVKRNSTQRKPDFFVSHKRLKTVPENKAGALPRSEPIQHSQKRAANRKPQTFYMSISKNDNAIQGIIFAISVRSEVLRVFAIFDLLRCPQQKAKIL